MIGLIAEDIPADETCKTAASCIEQAEDQRCANNPDGMESPEKSDRYRLKAISRRKSLNETPARPKYLDGSSQTGKPTTQRHRCNKHEGYRQAHYAAGALIPAIARIHRPNSVLKRRTCKAKAMTSASGNPAFTSVPGQIRGKRSCSGKNGGRRKSAVRHEPRSLDEIIDELNSDIHEKQRCDDFTDPPVCT